jgi:hypothetical protein
MAKSRTVYSSLRHALNLHYAPPSNGSHSSEDFSAYLITSVPGDDCLMAPHGTNSYLLTRAASGHHWVPLAVAGWYSLPNQTDFGSRYIVPTRTQQRTEPRAVPRLSCVYGLQRKCVYRAVWIFLWYSSFQQMCNNIDEMTGFILKYQQNVRHRAKY